jgi:hypothetical protein
VIETNLAKSIALWRLFHSSPENPIHPVKKLKPLLPYLYNKLKGGVDRFSKLAVTGFNNMRLSHSPHSQICWRHIMTAATNSFQIDKLCNVESEFHNRLKNSDHPVPYSTLKNKMAQQPDLVAQMEAVGHDFVMRWSEKARKLFPESQFRSTHSVSAAGDAAPSTVSKKKRMLLERLKQIVEEHEIRFSINMDYELVHMKLEPALVDAIGHAITSKEKRDKEWFETDEGKSLRWASFLVHSEESLPVSSKTSGSAENRRLYCVACYKTSQETGLLRGTGVRTQKQCSVCKVPLCPKCWDQFHSSNPPEQVAKRIKFDAEQ